MKERIILVLALATSLLTGCQKNAESSGEYSRIVSPFINVCNNGELYLDDSERLLFCDFEAMRTAYICAKPNCPHTDENSCSAFGLNHHPILYDGSIYYFTYDIYMNDDREYQSVTYIHKADSDGTNRKEIYKIDGLHVSIGDRMIVDGSTVYFTAEDVEFDEYGSSTNYTVGYLCSYDLESGDFENMAEIYKGYSSGDWVFGMWNGNIYYHTSVSENKINWETIDIGTDDVMSLYTIKQYCLNIAEKSVSENDLPDTVYVGEGYYIYETDSGICLKSENSDDIFIDNFKAGLSLIYILNGYVISSDGGICADINTGKVYKINPEYTSSSAFYEPVYYLNGNYILEKPLANIESMTDMYVAVSESDYIVEEIV